MPVVTLHDRNMQQFAIKALKIKIGLSLFIMSEMFIFSKNSVYKLRCGIHVTRSLLYPTTYEIESITNTGEKVSNLKKHF